jgi:hypothetical protein
METNLDKIEQKITDISTSIFSNLLFFLKDNQKSLAVSLFHYSIFIIGFYYFFFQSKPGDLYRILFFVFVFLGAISYFIFNKCFFTSIELKLSPDKNIIQSLMDNYFGKEIEGNITSKIVLGASSIIIGVILLNDYGILNITY